MNTNCNDSGLGSDMNIDNIFFYEDNHGNNQDNGLSLSSPRTLKNENDQMEIIEQVQESSTVTKSRRHRDHKFTQIKVNVGIDEDLKMILEMVKKSF